MDVDRVLRAIGRELRVLIFRADLQRVAALRRRIDGRQGGVPLIGRPRSKKRQIERPHAVGHEFAGRVGQREFDVANAFGVAGIFEGDRQRRSAAGFHILLRQQVPCHHQPRRGLVGGGHDLRRGRFAVFGCRADSAAKQQKRR